MFKKWQEPFDPDETKNYSREWNNEMDATQDTIVQSSFVIETPDTGIGVVDTSVDATGKIAILWLASTDKPLTRTKAGSIVLLNHTIVTTGGRTYNERIGLKIAEK